MDRGANLTDANLTGTRFNDGSEPSITDVVRQRGCTTCQTERYLRGIPATKRMLANVSWSQPFDNNSLRILSDTTRGECFVPRN